LFRLLYRVTVYLRMCLVSVVILSMVKYNVPMKCHELKAMCDKAITKLQHKYKKIFFLNNTLVLKKYENNLHYYYYTFLC